MRDYAAERIERLERLVCALALLVHNGKYDKGIEYYMVGEDEDVQASKDEVYKLITAMQRDMERTARTGQL